MARVVEPAVLNDWHVVGLSRELTVDHGLETVLLDRPIHLTRDRSGAVKCEQGGGRGGRAPADAKERFGFVWVCLGRPERDLVEIPEFGTEGQRFIPYGPIFVPTSGLRIVENFLDIAHLPFVHPGTLGEEPHTTVSKHKVERRRDPDEIHVTEVKFYQPQGAAASEHEGDVEYTWRVLRPFAIILTKESGGRSGCYDLIGLFVQPVRREDAVMHGFAAIYDDVHTDAEVLYFHHTIFGEDRRILSNQRPKSLPLNTQDEIPNKADAASTIYRRWLRELGVQYGALT